VRPRGGYRGGPRGGPIPGCASPRWPSSPSMRRPSRTRGSAVEAAESLHDRLASSRPPRRVPNPRGHAARPGPARVRCRAVSRRDTVGPSRPADAVRPDGLTVARAVPVRLPVSKTQGRACCTSPWPQLLPAASPLVSLVSLQRDTRLVTHFAAACRCRLHLATRHSSRVSLHRVKRLFSPMVASSSGPTPYAAAAAPTDAAHRGPSAESRPRVT
jgi:hypothetical protein